jgi:MFS family permease
MRGTGHYNLAQGGVATVQGVGASMSGLVAGLVVDHFGYSAAFLTSGAAACLAVAALFLAMPETAPVDGGNVSPAVPARQDGSRSRWSRRR